MVTFFIEENNGADETIINTLKIFGSTVKAANMNELKKVGWGWVNSNLLYLWVPNDDDIKKFSKDYVIWDGVYHI